nr:hypothetical protein [Tanacetum cinerariifolium]
MEKVDYHDTLGNNDKVEPVENEMASFLASKLMGVGYCPKRLLERWRESNVDDDYDQYDDDIGACFPRICAGYDPCRAAEPKLLAVVCKLYLSQSGMRIVTTVHSLFFPPFDEGFGHVRFFYPLLFAFILEMVGNSIYTVTSVLTQMDLDQHCATFGIPAELRSKLPDRNAIIKDSPMGKIGILIFLSCLLLARRSGQVSFSSAKFSRQNEQADIGFGFIAPTTEDVTSSSVTPTPERVLEDASHNNVVPLVTSAPTVLMHLWLSLQQRDVKIADLKARLEKSEAEAAKVIELRKHVSDLETTITIEVNVGWIERVSALELERNGLKNQVMGEGKMREEFVLQQDVAERRFAKRAMELDARIADVRRDMDNDLYPHMLNAIASRRWVVRQGFRLAVYKCARSVECRFNLGKVIPMAINKGIQQGLEAGIVH